eukprot:366375-Chlamydomonas_euryale.AAC.6
MSALCNSLLHPQGRHRRLCYGCYFSLTKLGPTWMAGLLHQPRVPLGLRSGFLPSLENLLQQSVLVGTCNEEMADERGTATAAMEPRFFCCPDVN